MIPKKGFGHSTVDMALKVADKAGVKHLALFHHNVFYDDGKIDRIEQEARQVFPGAFAAREAEEFVLRAAGG